MGSAEIDNPRTQQEINAECDIVADKMLAFLMNQLKLIQKKSEAATESQEIAALSEAAAKLISCFRDDWFYFAFPPQMNRVHTSRGIYSRKDQYQG